MRVGAVGVDELDGALVAGLLGVDPFHAFRVAPVALVGVAKADPFSIRRLRVGVLILPSCVTCRTFPSSAFITWRLIVSSQSEVNAK